jgi:hypothetical protein
MARAAITGQQVRDLMIFHAVTVAPDDTVKDALDLLVANNVAALSGDTGRQRSEPEEGTEHEEKPASSCG